ncbi:MAG TPA: cyclic nucleotide-binding domain-containing protein [Candidatus Edwardsbacteria bacterium]|nr:cyclic nucleotide-binding domain-containing protein [Candidatus Edwardsbacteria bacterium]
MVQRMPIKPGQIVIRKGDIGHCFYIIVDGELDVISGSGKVITTLRQGDPFGEIALLEDVPRTADVVARSDGHLLFINTPDFKDLLSENTGLLEQLEQLGKQRLEELEAKGGE